MTDSITLFVGVRDGDSDTILKKIEHAISKTTIANLKIGLGDGDGVIRYHYTCLVDSIINQIVNKGKI